jgi:hypothetical protein
MYHCITLALVADFAKHTMHRTCTQRQSKPTTQRPWSLTTTQAYPTPPASPHHRAVKAHVTSAWTLGLYGQSHVCQPAATAAERLARFWPNPLIPLHNSLLALLFHSIYTTRELGPTRAVVWLCPMPADFLSTADVDAMMAEVIDGTSSSAIPTALSALGARPRSLKPDELIFEMYTLDQTHIDAAQAHQDSGVALGIKPSPIKALRNTHHRLAQLLANGVDEGIAGKLCNYSTSRVSILKADPAFQELLSYYSGRVEDQWADFVATASNLSMDFLQHLQEQLDETPEKFTPSVAMEAIKLLADRSGHAPISKTVNLNVNADLGSKLDAARARLRAAQTLDT